MEKDKIQREVGDFYCRLWDDIDEISGSSIVNQFLFNVALPEEWFNKKKCLDVGCGSGFAIWAMERLGAECYACDICHKGLLNVSRKISSANSEYKLINGSILSLPFKSDFFDFVHCNGVLHHTVDPRQGFSELMRVTNSGGVLFISVYGKGGLYNAALQLARIFARVVPYRITDKIVSTLLKNQKVPNSFMPAKVSVLDNLYVPIRNSYKPVEIVQWFLEEGITTSEIVRTMTTIYDHNKMVNRVIHGEGYLQFRAKKSDG